jgi:hypothetical protein
MNTDKSQSSRSSRRKFLRQGAVVGAGAVLAPASNLLALESSTNANGPYPAEGMAGYSETDPLRPLKFQRRALGSCVCLHAAGPPLSKSRIS